MTLTHTPHLCAQMHGIEVDRDTVRPEDPDELIGDRNSYALLDRESTGEDSHESGQF